MKPSIFSFGDVLFGYDKKSNPVIDGLNFFLQKGHITTILGPNGAGKTTLLMLALSWLKPWQGSIRLADQPLANYGRRALGQKIALIPQNEHVPFEYTVLEYVLLGRAPYLPPLAMPTEEDERIAHGALEKVGIAHLYDHSILAISGGERQLVLAARALAQQPAILLLDEPTSHLDLGNKYRLVSILKELRGQGTTILMTTHEPELALVTSDEVILMDEGRVFLAGPVAKVATSANLSHIYRVPVKIVKVEGKPQVLWI